MVMDEDMEDLDVSVVIPVHNEKDAVRQCVLEMKEKMDGLPYRYEIIVVDDSSTDGSMDELSGLDVRIISFPHHRGGGTARLVGMREARAAIIVQTDADGTYPLDSLDEMLESMKTVDMVIGARRTESSRKLHLVRVLMKWFIKKLAGILVGQDIPDLNSGLRVYQKSIALKYSYLYPAGHSIMSTMTLAFFSGGHSVKFIPIEYRERIGKSSFNIFTDTYNYLLLTIATVAFFNPLRVLTPISLCIVAVAVGFTIRDIIRLGLGSFTLLLWVLAALIFILGIISEQIMRLSKHLSQVSRDSRSDKGTS